MRLHFIGAGLERQAPLPAAERSADQKDRDWRFGSDNGIEPSRVRPESLEAACSRQADRRTPTSSSA